MGCLLDGGWKLQCNKKSSGIRKVYVIPQIYIGGYTINTDGVITSINTSSKPFYVLEVKEQTTELIDKQVLDEKTGSIFWEQTLKLQLLKTDYNLRNLYLKLLNDKYIFIINDNNNLFWIVGKTFGCKLTQSESGPGKTFQDFNGNKMVFIGKESEPIRQVASNAFTQSTTVVNPIDTSQPVPVNPPSS